jgi:hypothetical protein
MDAFNFSLKSFSIDRGNVWLLSQISTSFLIFSYNTNQTVSGDSKARRTAGWKKTWDVVDRR